MLCCVAFCVLIVFLFLFCCLFAVFVCWCLYLFVVGVSRVLVVVVVVLLCCAVVLLFRCF